MSRVRLPRWLYPGMHLKRWLLLVFAGIVILGLGGAVFLVNVVSRRRARRGAVLLRHDRRVARAPGARRRAVGASA